MSLNFDDIFSDTTRNTSRSGQSAGQSYGMSPNVAEFWREYSQRFNPSNWSPVGNNQWQDQAAGSMAGFAGGLMPSFDSASAIARGGIDPASIARFQSPHTKQVVDAYQRNWEDQRGKTLAQNQAAAVRAGVPLMRSSQSAVNRALTEGNLEDTRSSTVANLYNQGFQQASDMAAKSAGMQLSGAQAASGIAGQQAGIMNNLFGQGTQLWNQAWQNGMMPYQLGQQYAGTFGSLVPLSGNNQWGNSWGNQSSSATPSPFSVGMGLGSLPFLGGWRPFGAASGGAITRDKAPPEARDVRPYDRLGEAFDAIHGLITRSRGGPAIRPFADGGAANGGWQTSVTPASSMDWGKVGKGLAAMGASRQQGHGAGDGADLLKSTQASLSQLMAGMTPRHMADGGVPEWGETGPQWEDAAPAAMPPAYAGASDAGSSPQDSRVWGANEPLPIERPGMGHVEPSSSRGVVAMPQSGVSRETSSAPAAKPSSGSGWFRGGIWSNNEEATPWQRLGLAMASVSGPRFAGPMNGFAKALSDQHSAALARSMKRRQMQMEADQFKRKLLMESKRIGLLEAGLTGRLPNGTTTIQGRTADDAHKVNDWKFKEAQNPDLEIARRIAIADKNKLTDPVARNHFIYGTPPTAAKASATVYKEVNGKIIALTPDGKAHVVMDAGTDFSKLPEFATKAAGFASRMVDAEKNLRSVLGKTGSDGKAAFDPTSASTGFVNSTQGTPLETLANGLFRSTEHQQYMQAAEQWIRAFLRKESGAAIGSDEFARDFKVYFPQPGDGPEVLKQKAEARLNAVRSFREETRGYFKHSSPEQAKMLDTWLAEGAGKSAGRLMPSDMIDQARAAIRKGAPRDKVIERLRSGGYDIPGDL